MSGNVLGRRLPKAVDLKIRQIPANARFDQNRLTKAGFRGLIQLLMTHATVSLQKLHQNENGGTAICDHNSWSKNVQPDRYRNLATERGADRACQPAKRTR